MSNIRANLVFVFLNMLMNWVLWKKKLKDHWYKYKIKRQLNIYFFKKIEWPICTNKSLKMIYIKVAYEMRNSYYNLKLKK